MHIGAVGRVTFFDGRRALQFMAEGPWFLADDAQREALRTATNATEVVWNTPLGQSLQLSLPFTVYPPREDTDALAAAMHRCSLPGGASVLEVGCGSGALSIFAASKGWRVTGCDVNPMAVAATRGNAQRHGHRLIVHEGGPGPAADGGDAQWGGDASYDLVVWNMPYLAPPDNMGEQHLGPFEEASLTDTSPLGLYAAFVQRLATTPLLAKGGVALLVVSSMGAQPGACSQAWGWGLAAQPVVRRTFEDGEVLDVLALWRPYEGSPMTHVATVESTNASLLLSDDAVGHRLSADRQGEGHGRQGRPWVSSPDAIEASWVVEAGSTVHHRPLDQVRLGHALVECMHRLSHHNKGMFVLKWPNDIYVHCGDGAFRKCGGILYEMTSRGPLHRLVVGIGLNALAPKNTSFGGVIDGGVSTDLTLLLSVVHAVVASLHEQIPHGAGPRVEDVATVAASCQDGFVELGPIQFEGQTVEDPRLLSSGDIQGSIGDDVVRISDSDAIVWAELQNGVHGG